MLQRVDSNLFRYTTEESRKHDIRSHEEFQMSHGVSKKNVQARKTTTTMINFTVTSPPKSQKHTGIRVLSQ